MSDKVSTVGELTGRHIGHGEVSFILPNAVVTGTITALSYDVQYERTVAGEKLYSVTATVSVENILLDALSLSTPCFEVGGSEGEWDTDTLGDF